MVVKVFYGENVYKNTYLFSQFIVILPTFFFVFRFIFASETLGA
jgi:hypothetical protein